MVFAVDLCAFVADCMADHRGQGRRAPAALLKLGFPQVPETDFDNQL